MMEDISVLNKVGRRYDRRISSNSNGNNLLPEKATTKSTIDDLIAEGGESFLHYINRFGLADEPNLLVLSAKNHYYYDDAELKTVTTLINVKKLNLIKHLDNFLQTVCLVLSPETNFIGCFSERDNQGGIKLMSRMYKGFINILDSRTDNEIDRRDFTRMVESYGFKIIDMTQINGLTYFRTKNNKRPAE
jgi:hypothetical protein